MNKDMEYNPEVLIMQYLHEHGYHKTLEQFEQERLSIWPHHFTSVEFDFHERGKKYAPESTLMGGQLENILFQHK